MSFVFVFAFVFLFYWKKQGIRAVARQTVEMKRLSCDRALSTCTTPISEGSANKVQLMTGFNGIRADMHYHSSTV